MEYSRWGGHLNYPYQHFSKWLPYFMSSSRLHMTKQFHEQINLGNAPSPGKIMPWTSLSIVMAFLIFLFGADWLGRQWPLLSPGSPAPAGQVETRPVHCDGSVVMPTLSWGTSLCRAHTKLSSQLLPVMKVIFWPIDVIFLIFLFLHFFRT